MTMMMTLFLADMSVGQGVGILASALTAIGIFLAGLIVQGSRANRAKIDALALAVQALEVKISPFWSSLQTKIADALHKPEKGAEVLDNLLEKLEALTLTPEELIVLEAQLQALIDCGTPDEVAKATLLLAVMKMKLLETAGKVKPTDARSIKQKKTEG